MSICPGLKRNPFRLLNNDTLDHTFEYLTMQELGQVAVTCRDLNEHTTRLISERGFNELTTYCKRFLPVIQLQKISELYKKLASLDSTSPLERQPYFEALQDEIFSCEMETLHIYQDLNLETLDSFLDNKKTFPAFWPSFLKISKAFVKMQRAVQAETNQGKILKQRRAYQETALLSLAGRESGGFVRAWNRDGGNLLLGKLPDTFIEKVAKKAISNGNYEVAKNLAKIVKGPLLKLFISQIADKYEKNPKVIKAPKKNSPIRYRLHYSSILKSRAAPIAERAESLAKTLNALWKQSVHREKREIEVQYQKSQVLARFLRDRKL